MAAMSLYKSDLSNMLSVVGRIPDDIVDKVGPAPGVGRRNWMDLADQLTSSKVNDVARSFLEDDRIERLASEERFKALLVSQAEGGTQAQRCSGVEERSKTREDRRDGP